MNRTKVKTEILHFKVDPHILDIIRQAYWFEEGRKEWAMDCLRSLGGNMTLDLAHDLLEGKNGLTTHDDGNSLTTTDKPDLEFQKELAEHKKYLEERKKEEEEQLKRPFCSSESSLAVYCKYKGEFDGKCMYSRMAGYKTHSTSCEGGECYLDKFSARKEGVIEAGAKLMGIKTSTATGEKVAEKKGDKCPALGCEFNLKDEHNCHFGMRNQWGCFQEDEGVSEKFAEFKMTSMTIGRQGEEGMKFVRSEVQKIFCFKYKGHQYHLKDSARNQGTCPHCDHQSKNDFWKPTDKAYIGHKFFGMKLNILGKQEKAYAVCFKCPKCDKKFFYHSPYKRAGK